MRNPKNLRKSEIRFTTKEIATLDCGELETGFDIYEGRPDDCPLIEEE